MTKEKDRPNRPGLFPLLKGLALCILTSVVFLAGCEKENGDPGKNDFNRQAMLENYGKNIIIPNYQTLKGSVNQLADAAGDFTDAPDTQGLQQLQEAWYSVAIDWQHCSTFEFGPASDVLLRASMNTFPTDDEQIEDNIASGSYNLETAGNIDAIGLPALDYLIHGTETNNEAIVSQFVDDHNAANRKQYLTDLVAQMQANVNTVAEAWDAEGGNYIETFIQADGTDVGSSLGQLVNQINFDFEIIKNAKIGIPLGAKTLGSPLPENVEAYYGGQSLDLAEVHIQAIDNIFHGRDRQGNDSTGIDNNLDFLDAQHSSGEPLTEAIADQFSACLSAVEDIPGPLSDAVENNATPVEQAHNELKKQVVLLKTDMPSALSVLITYQDNDGD